MRITFTRYAQLELKLHCNRVKEFAGAKAARKLRKRIFDRTKDLKTLPNLGKRDPRYDDIDANIRFLIEGHYKIFYQITDEVIFILDVADTRGRQRDIFPV